MNKFAIGETVTISRLGARYASTDITIRSKHPAFIERLKAFPNASRELSNGKYITLALSETDRLTDEQSPSTLKGKIVAIDPLERLGTITYLVQLTNGDGLTIGESGLTKIESKQSNVITKENIKDLMRKAALAANPLIRFKPRATMVELEDVIDKTYDEFINNK